MTADPRVIELADRLVENQRERRRLDAEDYRIRMEIAARISGFHIPDPELEER